MVIIIAPDKFKGSLTAQQVCASVEKGIHSRYPQVQTISVPMADGGEGTCALLTNFFNGELKNLEVHGPLFDMVNAEIGISSDKTTAFIEMANASGLQLIPPEKRNPLYTSTVGTGELIRYALDYGVKKIILGIGGSATNDAGIGMATALGYEFLDAKGKSLKPTGENLVKIDSILNNNVHPRLSEVEFIALCDVDNPLHGSNGAAYVYGPQKGANEETVRLLDAGLVHFEKKVNQYINVAADFPGAGAAGGLGGGAKIFLQAKLRSGINYIIDATNLKDMISRADYVITGEGKLDEQSLSGKVVVEVSKLALHFHKPVVAICGQCDLNEEKLKKAGITKVLALVDESNSPEETIRNAHQLIIKKIIDNLDLNL